MHYIEVSETETRPSTTDLIVSFKPIWKYSADHVSAPFTAQDTDRILADGNGNFKRQTIYNRLIETNPIQIKERDDKLLIIVQLELFQASVNATSDLVPGIDVESIASLPSYHCFKVSDISVIPNEPDAFDRAKYLDGTYEREPIDTVSELVDKSDTVPELIRGYTSFNSIVEDFLNS